MRKHTLSNKAHSDSDYIVYMFGMGSRCSQEALILCSVTVRAHHMFCLHEKQDKQLPPMSALLIQISIHTGKYFVNGESC